GHACWKSRKQSKARQRWCPESRRSQAAAAAWPICANIQEHHETKDPSPGNQKASCIASACLMPVERQQAARLLGVFADLATLVLQEILHGMCQARLGQPMKRVRQHRLEATGDLVFALCARVEPGQAMSQAVFDALVIAGLEVQVVELGQ